MRAVTDNVFTETKWRGCNPSMVVTSHGVVVIDTPQLPTKAIEMRRDAEELGPIRYVVNTEHHVDHIFGNFYFRGDAVTVQQARLADLFMKPSPELDPFDYAAEAIPTDDPDGAGLFPDRDSFYRDLRRADIVFGDRLSLEVGDHTFELVHTPGHTPGQTTVYCPEERTLFTGDSLFVDCQTWLMTSDVASWLATLDRLTSFDVDRVIPGHGEITDLSYVKVQRWVLLEWVGRVAEAVAKGWSRDETVDRVRVQADVPVDVGQQYMLDHIQTHNVGALYDRLVRDAPQAGEP